MSFNPSEHFMLLKGKQYLPVNARVAWFREEHPDWAILTSFVSELSGPDFTTFRCDILDGTGRIIATGHKTEHRAHFPDNNEKAETGAIGRALALCGYGTLFAQELETPETPAGDLRIVDAPIAPQRKPKAGKTEPVGDMGDSEYPIGSHFDRGGKKPDPQPDAITALSNEFKQEVEMLEQAKVGAARLKQVFAIVTNDQPRTEASLRIAIDTLKACETTEDYKQLLVSMGTGENAPF